MGTGDIDDSAIAAFLHARDGVLDSVETGAEVEGDDLLPGVVGEGFDWGGELLAGVVHEDVD